MYALHYIYYIHIYYIILHVNIYYIMHKCKELSKTDKRILYPLSHFFVFFSYIANNYRTVVICSKFIPRYTQTKIYLIIFIYNDNLVIDYISFSQNINFNSLHFLQVQYKKQNHSHILTIK